MATIHTELVFGVKVAIQTPMTPSKTALDGILSQAQTKLNELLVRAIGTALKTFLPGLTVQITDAKTSLTVEKVDVI
jgi:hypothetical protein